MIKSFFKNLLAMEISEPKLVLPKEVCFHLFLDNPGDLLNFFEMTRVYEITKGKITQLHCEFKVNNQTVKVVRHSPRYSVPWFKNDEFYLDTLDFMNVLFGLLPIEKQQYFIDNYYKQDDYSDLYQTFNHWIDVCKFQTMKKITEQHVKFENIRILKQDEKRVEFLADGSGFRNMKTVVYRDACTIWFYSSVGMSFDLHEFIFQDIEKALAAEYPGISFIEFADPHKTHFCILLANVLIKQLTGQKEYQLKAKFNPQLQLDKKFVRQLET